MSEADKEQDGAAADPARKLSGPAGAAVLLMAMGEENAASVLKHLKPEDVQVVSAAMAEIDSVSQKQIAVTLEDFADKIKSQSSLGAKSGEYLENTLVRALGKERAVGVLSEANREGLAPSMDALKWMPDRVVAGMVKDEHTQFISIVLSYLDAEKAARIVECLPEKKRSDLMVRISRLDYIHPTALAEIDQILEQRISDRFEIELAAAGGIPAVAAILNGVSTSEEEKILAQLAEVDEELAEKIRDNMFVFENLLKVDDRGIQSLLREVPSDLLVKALKGTSDEVQKKLFDNMSRRAAVLLKDDLDASGPMRVAEVEEAQKEILTIALGMAEEGKISLGGKDDDFL